MIIIKCFLLFSNSQKHIFSILSFCETTFLMISRLSPPQKTLNNHKQIFLSQALFGVHSENPDSERVPGICSKKSESESSLMRPMRLKENVKKDILGSVCSPLIRSIVGPFFLGKFSKKINSGLFRKQGTPPTHLIKS